MSSPSKRQTLFKRLEEGLEEGIQFAQGQASLRTFEAPMQPPMLQARAIVSLRRRLKMSQSLFARVLNVSPKTVQSWEQGERQPSQAALRLLQILRAKPTLVCRIVGVPHVTSAREG